MYSHEKWVMGAFAGYSLIYIIAFLLNGLWGTLTDLRFSNIDHEIRFLAFIPIFFLFRYIKLDQSALWGGILTGALLSGGYALLSYFWWAPGVRVSGSYHSIAFGDLSLAMAFMSIPALDYFKNKSRAFRLLPIVALIFGLLACLLSGTRGAWIAIPALTLILFYYLSPMMGLVFRSICLLGVMAALLAAYYIPATHIANRVDAFFQEINNYQIGERDYSSIGTRIEGWHVAWNIFMDHPVIGAGPGNYKPLMKQMIADGQQYNSAVKHKQPHGAVPSTLADTGILGLSMLLGVFLTPLWAAFRFIRSWKPVRHLGYAMIVLVISFMHFGLTETIFSRNINIVFYIILTAAILSVASNEIEEK